MDPYMGILGAILVTSWAWGLIRQSSKVYWITKHLAKSRPFGRKLNLCMTTRFATFMFGQSAPENIQSLLLL